MNEVLHGLNSLLSKGFREVLVLSMMASALVLFILLFRRLLRGSLRPGWLYLLWLPLLLRLVIPWSPESPLSLYGWIPQHWGVEAAQTGRTASGGDARDLPGASVQVGASNGDPLPLSASGEFSGPLQPIEQAANAEDASAPLQTGTEPADVSLGWISAASWIWAAGALAIFFATLLSGRFFGRQIRRDASSSARGPAAENKLALLETCRAELGLRRAPTLVITDRVKVPTVFGALRPRLLLPAELAEQLSERQLRHVLLHELAHIKRRDIAVNLLTFVLKTIHWFNPLIAYAFRKLREDQETACDELALSRLGKEERREYGLTLIRMLERQVVPVKLPNASGLWSNRREIGRRMTMIATYRKNTWKSVAAGLSTVLLLGGCALAGPSSGAEEAQNGTSTSQPKPKTQAAAEATDGSSGANAAGSKRSTIPSAKADTPPEGEEGEKVAAFGDISVYAAETGEDPQNPLLRVFTVRDEKGQAASYAWNYEPGGGGRSVLISEGDVDGDGQNEIVLIVPTGNGTELSLQGVHVLKKKDLAELPVEDPVAKANETVRSSIEEQDGIVVLNAELNGTHVTKRYEEIENMGFLYDKIGFGSHTQYTLGGDTLIATLSGRASITEFPVGIVATYDRGLSVSDMKLHPYPGLYYDASGLPKAVARQLGFGENVETDDWTVRMENGLYRIEVPGMGDNSGQGSTYGVNPVTGTVFDGTSGAPLAVLTRAASSQGDADSQGLRSSDGSVYQAALDARVRELAKDAGWKIADGDDWFEGFEGDGSVLCRVEREGKETTVKADLFTGFWTETS